MNYGILWDYNGVIVNDEHLQEKAVANVVAEYGPSMNHEMYEQECLGRPDKAAFENLQKIFPEIKNVPVEKLIEDKTKDYQVLIESESILWPGIKETLTTLKEHYEMVIVTGALRSEVEPVLKKEGIFNLFKRVITADEIERGKPNPEGYLKGVEELNLPKESIVVIEDTPSGVQAAKAAGVRCIAVLQSVSGDKLQAADKIMKNVNELTSDLIQQVLS